MQVKKRRAALGADLELHLGLAPDVLGVKGVDLIARFQVLYLLLILPRLVRLQPLLVVWLRISVTVVRLLLDHQLDGAVDDFRLLQRPLADVLAAVRALLAVDERLIDASLAERVAADGGAAGDDVVHADGTVQLHDGLERLAQTYPRRRRCEIEFAIIVYLSYLLCLRFMTWLPAVSSSFLACFS